jgi:glucokinase
MWPGLPTRERGMVTVGVDLGGTNIQVMVLDHDDARRGWAKMRTPVGGNKVHILEVMDAAIHAALGDAEVSIDDVTAIGVGTPGVVIDGTVGGAANVPGWFDRFSLRDGLQDRVHKPVRVINDVTAAAAAEHQHGAGRGYDNVFVVFVGTGVGGGLVLNGVPYEGSVGGAGEFGHTVVGMGGAMCPCGRRGCVEAYAGRRSMENAVERAIAAGEPTIVPSLVEQRGVDRITSGVIRDALAKGDPLVANLVDDCVAALGAGIASAVNLLDVEAVVLGGGLSDKLGPQFLRRVEAAMRPNLFLVPARVRVFAATLGDESGALGAALIARS